MDALTALADFLFTHPLVLVLVVLAVEIALAWTADALVGRALQAQDAPDAPAPDVRRQRVVALADPRR